MGNPQYSGGEAGYFGIATESRPDQPVAGPTTPPTAALVAAAGLVNDGTHAYVKTDVTAMGESAPTAASNVVTTVTADHGQVAVSAVAVGATGVIARKIYRSKAGRGALGPFYLVTTIADNTTTTYTDNTADSALGAQAPTANAINGLPGQWVPPTQFIMNETNTFDETPAPISREVYGGQRDSDEGHSLGKSITGGNITYGCYYNNGFELLVAAVGKDILVTAIASDTTVSIVTGDMSVLNLSSGAGAYQKGMLAFIGPADATQEVRIVTDWDAGGKNLTVPKLRKVHADTGTAVVTVDQHKTMPLTFSDTGHLQLRTISVSDNVGGKYENRYPGQLVGHWNLKGAPAKFDVQADFLGSFDRQLANGQNGTPNPTPFNFSDPSWDDISFEFTDGFATLPWDVADTGTATMQLVIDMESWELDINNMLQARPTFDGQDTTRHFVMNRAITFKFGALNAASYPQVWTNFLKRQVDFAIFLQVVKNIGTVNAPVWRAMGIYLPNVRAQKGQESKAVNAVVGETVECVCRRTGGLEKVYFFTINDFATAV